MNGISTVIIFADVFYLPRFRIEIPVKGNKVRGERGLYPVELFYTSNTADYVAIGVDFQRLHRFSSAHFSIP